MDPKELPEEYQPVSAWGFVGLFLLSTIPCIGLICTIVFACGGVRKKNIVNFARAQLIMMAISFVITLIVGVLIALSGVALTDGFKSL